MKPELRVLRAGVGRHDAVTVPARYEVGMRIIDEALERSHKPKALVVSSRIRETIRAVARTSPPRALLFERGLPSARKMAMVILISFCAVLPSKGAFAQATSQSVAPVSDRSTDKATLSKSVHVSPSQDVTQTDVRDSKPADHSVIAQTATDQQLPVQSPEGQPEQGQSETESAAGASQTATSDQEPARRALPAPLDEIFPSSEYLGPTPLIGVPDTDPVYPLTKALWSLFPAVKAARIKMYGWAGPGISVSTSSNSNIPESYAIVPNHPELDQGVVRIERVPDTVQTDHVDWGFRLTNMYGIDYRWTTAQGWISGQLLHHNRLYGYDPVEAYALIYVPSVAEGMVIKVGRYISPPDIEAQLAPDNYLFTHSLMFTFDCYTQTGVNAAIKFNNYWSILFGIHAGDDIAPWNGAAHPTAMAMVRWVSASNNDSLWGGIDSLNDGKFKDNHDNLQQFNLTWTHRFNDSGTLVTSTETYYIFQTHALVGGTVNFGPPHSWFEGTGPGALIPGNAPAFGIVNYTAWKFSKRDFLTVRPIDYMVDFKGERSGFATTMSSWTVGVTHRFNGLISVRPEVRYEYAFSAKPWDNGTRRSQFMFAGDAILRF